MFVFYNPKIGERGPHYYLMLAAESRWFRDVNFSTTIYAGPSWCLWMVPGTVDPSVETDVLKEWEKDTKVTVWESPTI